jgi:acetolactate synthase-1/2/3 large subunit
MVRQWQELFYQDNYVSVAMTQPDFLKLAEAYGIRSMRITEKEQVDEAIREAESHPGPVLIDFQVQAEGNVWPMVPAGASLKETVEAPRDASEVRS